MRLTTFVIGAGASVEFGLPIGTGLATQIGAILADELARPMELPILKSVLQARIPGNYGDAARDVSGGMIAARSIDRFLHSRRDDELVTAIGKRAIAATLARSEASSSMGHVREEDWHSKRSALLNTSQTWIARLFAYLQEGVGPAQAANVLQSCRFIVFNYDRCLERYLQLAFELVLRQPPDVAAAIVADLPVVHVYGALGTLPSGSTGVPFGPPDYLLDDMASALRTFTESADDRILSHARDMIEEADRLVMLGFGFDPLNLSALFPNALRPGQRVMATAMGLPSYVQGDFAANYLDGRVADTIFYGMSCSDLIATDEFKSFIR